MNVIGSGCYPASIATLGTTKGAEPGEYLTWYIDLTVDTTPPTAEIIAPPTDSIWYKENLASQFRYADTGGSGLDSCLYKVVNKGIDPATVSWVPIDGGCSGDGPFEPSRTITVGPGQVCYTEGGDACTIYVMAYDGAGYSGGGTKSYHIDWTPPETEIK